MSTEPYRDNSASGQIKDNPGLDMLAQAASQARKLLRAAHSTKPDDDMGEEIGSFRAPINRNLRYQIHPNFSHGENSDAEATQSAAVLEIEEAMAYENEPANPHNHSNCSHGPITAENGYEFFCEIPRGCYHQWQKSVKESRKCISNYFGRNKRCTLMIKHPVIWCRSHYQTNAYHSSNWRFQKLALIIDQLRRIEKYDPGTLYTVILKNSEAIRLDSYCKGRSETIHMPRSHQRGTNFEAPLDVLQYVEENWIGRNKSMDHCISFVTWSRIEMLAGRIQEMPHVEFLPQFPGCKIQLQLVQRHGLLRAEGKAEKYNILDPNVEIKQEDDIEVETIPDDDSDEPSSDEEIQSRNRARVLPRPSFIASNSLSSEKVLRRNARAPSFRGNILFRASNSRLVSPAGISIHRDPPNFRRERARSPKQPENASEHRAGPLIERAINELSKVGSTQAQTACLALQVALNTINATSESMEPPSYARIIKASGTTTQVSKNLSPYIPEGTGRWEWRPMKGDKNW